MKPQAKVSRVMREFKQGELKSSSGQKVTNPKQAIAIGLSEAGISKKAKGGEMKESKAMMKKEVSFMKKKGAPKSMLKHEMAEMKGMKKGGGVKKMGMGGSAVPYGFPSGAKESLMAGSKSGQLPPPSKPRMGPGNPGPMPRPVSRPPMPPVANPVSRPPTPRPPNPVSRPPLSPRKGPSPLTLNKPSGMAKGGLAAGHKSADGIARKGKTKAEQVKMAKGGTAKMRKGGYC
jgi:hypothetical protein